MYLQSGTRGLLHSHVRVRSRCCYLLLNLVKHTAPVLRSFVETAVFGIRGLLSNDEFCSTLRPDDSLYLFETMGLLLGKTGLEAEKQRGYLVEVVTPHIERVRQEIAFAVSTADTDHETADSREEILASSIAAVAHLSKGFSKPSDGVLAVLSESVHVVLSFLRTAPTSELVRNKTMVFLQRMIVTIDNRVLPEMPQFLSLLIEHCDADDILFVCQLFNQLCLKFKESSVPAIDGQLIPLLRKCQELVPSQENGNGQPPHICAEQLAVKKLIYVVLQHIVSNKATSVLVSPSNFGSLESILETVRDGATRVQDPTIQKTCLRFFRDLVAQWLPLEPPADDVALYGRGLLVFTLTHLIPDVINCFFQSQFEEKDALYSRVIHEFANILFSTRSHLQLVEGDRSELLYNSLLSCIERIADSRNGVKADVDRFADTLSVPDVQTWLVESILGMHKRTRSKKGLL